MTDEGNYMKQTLQINVKNIITHHLAQLLKYRVALKH